MESIFADREDGAEASGVMPTLARSWLHEGPCLLMLIGSLLGATGMGLTIVRIPAGAYVALTGVVWVLLCSALLASVALRREVH